MGLLTRPQTLHFSRKHHRYAKGSISEGAVTAQAVTEGVFKERSLPQGDGFPQQKLPQSRCARQIPPFVTCGDIFPRPGEVVL